MQRKILFRRPQIEIIKILEDDGKVSRVRFYGSKILDELVVNQNLYSVDEKEKLLQQIKWEIMDLKDVQSILEENIEDNSKLLRRFSYVGKAKKVIKILKAEEEKKTNGKQRI